MTTEHKPQDVSTTPDDLSHYMRATAWYRSILRDVAHALRKQDYLTREQIAESIERSLREGSPDGK
jgi:hypothetical protein